MFPLRPHISKSTTKVIIVIIWIISLLLAIPMALAYTIVNHTDDIPQCLPVNISWVFFLWYKNFLCLVQYFIPCILISGAYIRSAGITENEIYDFLIYCESKMLTHQAGQRSYNNRQSSVELTQTFY